MLHCPNCDFRILYPVGLSCYDERISVDWCENCGSLIFNDDPLDVRVPNFTKERNG